MHNHHPHLMERIQKHRQSILQYAHEIGIKNISIFEDSKQHQLALLIESGTSLDWDYFGFADVVERIVGDELPVFTLEGAKETGRYSDADLSHAIPL